MGADDDDIELDYVEALLAKQKENPKASLIMGGYEVEDTMAVPNLRFSLTKHHVALADQDLFERLKKYVVQPDHLGKSRLNWSMFRTKDIQRAFRECGKSLPAGRPKLWADYPIDFRMLSYGDIAVVERTIWIVKLLPSSEGQSMMRQNFKKLTMFSDRMRTAMMAVVNDSAITEAQKKDLIGRIKRKARREKLELFVYYQIIGRWPWAARQVKRLWYLLFS